MPTPLLDIRIAIAWPIWAGGYPEVTNALSVLEERTEDFSSLLHGVVNKYAETWLTSDIAVRDLQFREGGYRALAGLFPGVRLPNSVEVRFTLAVGDALPSYELASVLRALPEPVVAFCRIHMPGAGDGANVYDAECEVETSGTGLPLPHRQTAPLLVVEDKPGVVVESKMGGAQNRQAVAALILKGGGVKGLAFAGALVELEKYYQFQIYVGASAGAIAATLLAAGHSPSELLTILRSTNFSTFLDTSKPLRLLRLIARGAMHSGNAFRRWIRELLNAKVRNVNSIRLEDLPRRAILFASSTAEGRIWFDSHGKGRDVGADFAVRCSMAIPFFFDAMEHGGSRIVDGGVLNNFPIRALIEEFPEVGSDFVALYLGSTRLPDHRPRSLARDLLSMWLGQDELALVDKFGRQTVVIDPDPIRTTDFTLTDQENDFLVLQGKAAALRFVQARKLPHGPRGDEVTDAVTSAMEKRQVVLEGRRRRTLTWWLKATAVLAVAGVLLATWRLRDRVGAWESGGPGGSGRASLMLLAPDIERHLRGFMATTGFHTIVRPNAPLPEAVDALASTWPLSQEFRESVRRFWDVRERINHGYNVPDDDVRRAIDSGKLILRTLEALRREVKVVAATGVQLYSDEEGHTPRIGVWGLVVESTSADGNETKSLQVFPTTRTDYRTADEVTWDFDLGTKYGETWYRDPKTGKIRYAWQSSAAFVGRPLKDLEKAPR